MTPAFALPGAIAPDLASIESLGAGSPFGGIRATLPQTTIDAMAAKLGAGKASSSDFGGWLGARGITLLLGFLLLAGAIFSHPAVIEKTTKAAKAAAVAA